MKAEKLQAKRAYDLLHVSIWDIWEPPEYVRGKMTKKDVSRALIDEDLKLDDKRQILYSDAMYVKSNKFLITVCKPPQLVIWCRKE